jgi:hypothetical protein
MTSLKTVLLGSAAALVATGAAQAADLPVKKAAAAVAYVEVCPAYGAGFYKLPGTDICVRHFGSAKFGVGFMDKRRYVSPDGDLVVNRADSNTSGWQWTIRPGWDFRSPTEWGTLRTVVQMRVDQRAGFYDSEEANLIGTQRVNNAIHRGYIEWAGFTIGKAGSFFIYWDQDDIISAQGGSPKESIPMLIAYTMPLGAGTKATVALETTSQWTEGYNDARLGGVLGAGSVEDGPFRFFGGFDVVGALSTEGSWGSAKLAGLLHFQQTNHVGNGGVQINANDVGTGYGLLAGVTFMLPSMGKDDQLLLEATHCSGVSHACGGTGGGASNTATQFERSGQYLDGLQREDVDAYLVPNASGGWDFIDVKWTNVAAQLRHYWAPLWRSNLTGTYQWIRTPQVAKNIALGDGGRGDANVWDIGANLIWGKSRRTAEIGVEVIYKSVQQDLPNPTRPADLPRGTDINPSGWIVNGFIQRAW